MAAKSSGAATPVDETVQTQESETQEPETQEPEISLDEELTAAEIAARSAVPEPTGGPNFLIVHEGVGQYVKDEVIPPHAFAGDEAERLVGLGAIIGTYRAATRAVAPPPPPLVRVEPIR